MGIIDDYYGGYESLALFMDEDGCVDFEAAYDAQLPDYHDDEYAYASMDPFDRAINYKLKQVMRERPVQEGWTDTGNVTAAGKPIWEGCCHGCGTHTTVPFEPRQGNPMPRCRECYAKYTEKKARKQAKGKRGARGSSAGQQGSSMSAGASSSKAAQQCTDAPDVVAHDQAQS